MDQWRSDVSEIVDCAIIYLHIIMQHDHLKSKTLAIYEDNQGTADWCNNKSHSKKRFFRDEKKKQVRYPCGSGGALSRVFNEIAFE